MPDGRTQARMTPLAALFVLADLATVAVLVITGAHWLVSDRPWTGAVALTLAVGYVVLAVRRVRRMFGRTT